MAPRPPSPGSGASGAVKVTVSSGSATGETSSSTTVEAAAAGDGTWKALLPAQHAGTGHTITASSGSGTITLERVAFGDGAPARCALAWRACPPFPLVPTIF